jgi:putative phosphoesterase
MSIYVISDTHIPERIGSLPAELTGKLKRGDILFHCGDFTSYAIFEQLRGLAEFHGVYGNMDEFSLRSELPESEVVEISGKKIGITHGRGSPSGLAQRIYKSFREKPDVILFGHSHSRTHQVISSTLMFNPGAVSGGWGTPPSYGQLFIGGEDIWGEHYDL